MPKERMLLELTEDKEACLRRPSGRRFCCCCRSEFGRNCSFLNG